MPRTLCTPRIARRQAGAALIVGLLLLLVLTVLAVSGMNASSFNLMMAGNTQYSQNSFQAAESGIERAIASFDFNPDPTRAPEEAKDIAAGDVTTYTVTSTLQLNGVAQPPLPGTGASVQKTVTYHFEIDSTGTSRRGATARNVQALAVIAPYVDSAGPLPDTGGGGGPGSKVLE